MSKSIRLRIALGFGLMLALLLVVSLANRGSIRAYEEASERVDRSRRVHGSLVGFLSALSAADAGQSRYLLTSDEVHLRRHSAALTEIRQHQGDLRSLIEDPEQAARLTELESAAELRLREMERVLELSRTQDMKAAVSRLSQGLSRSALESIRSLTERMLREEQVRLAARQREARDSQAFALQAVWLTTAGALLMVIAAGTLLARSITRPLEELSRSTERIGAGDFHHRAAAHGQDELAALAMAFNRMAEQLSIARARSQRVDWAKNESARITELMQGHPTVEALGAALVPDLARTVEASHAVLYVRLSGDPDFRKVVAFGESEDRPSPEKPDGLTREVSRVGREVWMSPAPEGMRLRTSLAEGPVGELAILPARFDDVTWGLLELASPRALDEQARTVLRRAAQFLGIVLRSLDGNERLRILLEEAQLLNRGLVSQRAELEASQARLEAQQSELTQLNEELEEKARQLWARNTELERKNEQLEQARKEVETKAAQLARSTRFKSEFLANVSHELRTPLNSQLILARLLEENPEENLTPKQLEYVSTILKSGRELLRLINDVLDLSKIEAGRMNVVSETVNVESLIRELERTFRDMPRHPGVSLSFELESVAPREIVTDPHRLRQILANLLGNAIKFTHQGSVVLRVGAPPTSARLHSPQLVSAARVIAFWVEDTGIGISPSQQAAIFEAFRQADGSTSRTYGGTGLGLSISRELATLLGGEIHLTSKPGEGSSFALLLPDRMSETEQPWAREPVELPAPEERATGGHVLVVARDAELGTALAEAARRVGLQPDVVTEIEHARTRVGPHLKGVVLAAGEGDGASQFAEELSRTRTPLHRVESSGAQAIDQASVFFDRAKTGISEALPSGDPPPAEARGKTVMLVDDDMRNVFALTAVLEREGLQVVFAEDGESCLAQLDANPSISLVLMDLVLPGLDGHETTRRIRQHPRYADVPVIAVTARAMPGDRERILEAGASDYLAKPIDTGQLLQVLRSWLYGKSADRAV